MSFSSALVLSFIPCHFLTKKTKQKTLSYKTTEKRLWLTNTKMYFNSNQLPAECIKSYQELFIIQTIKRNDSLKTTQTCFWTTALHCSFVHFQLLFESYCCWQIFYQKHHSDETCSCGCHTKITLGKDRLRFHDNPLQNTAMAFYSLTIVFI